MTKHKTVSRAEWQAARDVLLKREKEHTRMGDELARQRQELPWVAIEKEYRFETSEGTRTLDQLFDGRSQLMIYCFMFGPPYEAGCPTCSSSADCLNGALPHLHPRDMTFMFVSRAPLAKLHAYRKRMGWSIPWVSSMNTDFSIDFGGSYTEKAVREQFATHVAEFPPIVEQNAKATGTNALEYVAEGPALAVFTLHDGKVYQTYGTQARGTEFIMGYYPILDRLPKGRDEGEGIQLWVRRKDEYAGVRG